MTGDGVGNEDPDPNGVTGKTTAQMQTQGTFTDPPANWDFSVEPVWRMCEDGVHYPKLAWEFPAGDFICSNGVDMADFVVLSNAWLSDDTPSANWNENCDLDGSGAIDTGDLMKFAENWLEGTN